MKYGAHCYLFTRSWSDADIRFLDTAAELGAALRGAMPLLVSGQNGVRGPQWWNMSVMVILMVAPLIVLAFALERYIAKGLLVGAVKG